LVLTTTQRRLRERDVARVSQSYNLEEDWLFDITRMSAAQEHCGITTASCVCVIRIFTSARHQ